MRRPPPTRRPDDQDVYDVIGHVLPLSARPSYTTATRTTPRLPARLSAFGLDPVESPACHE